MKKPYEFALAALLAGLTCFATTPAQALTDKEVSAINKTIKAAPIADLPIKAAELVLEGQFGQMAALRGTDIVAVPLSEAVSANRRLDLRYYEEAREFFPG